MNHAIHPDTCPHPVNCHINFVSCHSDNALSLNDCGSASITSQGMVLEVVNHCGWSVQGLVPSADNNSMLATKLDEFQAVV